MFLTNLWSLLNYLNVFWYLLAHHHTWCVILYHSLNNHWFTILNNVADQTITNLHASKQAIDCSSEEQGVSNIVEWSKIATIFLFSINGCNNFCLVQSIPIFRCLDLCPSFYQSYLLGLEDPSDDWRTTSLIHTSLQKWIRLEMCGPSSNVEYGFVNLSRFVLFPFLTLQ